MPATMLDKHYFNGLKPSADTKPIAIPAKRYGIAANINY
jgi:hypothetical protein